MKPLLLTTLSLLLLSCATVVSHGTGTGVGNGLVIYGTATSHDGKIEPFSTVELVPERYLSNEDHHGDTITKTVADKNGRFALHPNHKGVYHLWVEPNNGEGYAEVITMEKDSLELDIHTDLNQEYFVAFSSTNSSIKPMIQLYGSHIAEEVSVSEVKKLTLPKGNHYVNITIPGFGSQDSIKLISNDTVMIKIN